MTRGARLVKLESRVFISAWMRLFLDRPIEVHGLYPDALYDSLYDLKPRHSPRRP